MKFNEYQEAAATTALGLATTTLWYPALGLVGEAGEVAEKVKKFYRDGERPNFDEDLLRECGDVLWYISALLSKRKLSLEDCATMNIAKLAKRQMENKIHGDGDNR